MRFSPLPIKPQPKAFYAGVGVFILFAATLSTSVLAADVAPTVFATSISAYNSGDFPSAEANLLTLAKGDGSLDEKMQARFFLADICVEAEDFSCVFTNNTELLNLMSQVQDKKQQASYWLQINPSFIEQFLVSQNYSGQDIPKLLDLWNHTPFGEILPDKYLMLQTTAISYYGLQLDYAGARRSIARLIARAIVLPPRYYLFPRYLAEIVAGLTLTRDQNRALLIAAKFDGLIRGTLPKPSPTHIRYLEVTAALEGNIGTQTVLTDALSRISEAETQIHNIKLAEAWKTNELARIALQRTEILILKNDFAGALSAHKASPLQASRTAIQKRGSFSSLTEMDFALVDLFLSHISNKQVDFGWAKPLKARQTWETGHSIDAIFEAYRKFGLAFVSDDDTSRANMMHEAARDIVNQFDRSLTAHAGTFPLPDFVDRIILNMELVRLSKSSALTSEEKSFIVRAVDILQRDIYHTRGDALYVMAGLGSEQLRRIEHTWLLLNDRRNELEVQALVSYGQAQPSTTAGQSVQANQAGLDDRANLVDLNEQLQASTEAIQRSGLSTRIELPDIGVVQQATGNQEAVVSEAASFGTAFELCAGPNDSFEFIAKPIPQEFPLNIKLLRDALVSLNAPSPELDKQYPARAAVQINQFILGGLEGCLSKATHVYYSPIVDLADIPLAALLEQEPPRDGSGYDLSKAEWLIKKYDFSYESSLEEFVAARKLSGLAGGELPFLGVGDPDLNKPSADGKTAGEILAMRGAKDANGTIKSLPDLPDTAKELNQVAALIPGSQLLLGDHATEEQLRRMPIGDYDVIEFATHGLISGELDGLNEPGLVLTPVAATDTDEGSDGFLSSSEISKLALRARLVVLSACNTAHFEVDKFVGSIRGLAASLALSGVPSVVASLWPVDSTVSKTLMVTFYTKLKQNSALSVSGAFADSVRDFLRSAPSSAYLHPRFWSSFTVYGDGGSKLEHQRAQPSGGLVQFDSDAEIGEFSSLVPGQNGDAFFDSRSGNWNGTRLASLIEKRSLIGKIEWQYEDRSVESGPIAVGKSEIFSAGDVSATDGRRIAPVIRAFTFTGTLLWQKTLDEGDSQAFIGDVTISQSGNFWAVLRAQTYTGTDSDRSWLHVFEVSPKGVVLKDWSIELEKLRAHVFPVRILARGQDLYIFSPTGSKFDSVSTDDFGQSRYCSSLVGSEVFFIDPHQSKVKDVGVLRNVIVRFAGFHDGHLLIAGTRTNSCSIDGVPVLAEMIDDFDQQKGSAESDSVRLKDVYVGEGLLGGAFTGFISNNGRITLSGNISSRTSEFKAFGTSVSVRHVAAGSGYERSDAFVVNLDKLGQADIRFINAGTNTFIDGSATERGQLILAGAVGFHPLWARYSVH